MFKHDFVGKGIGYPHPLWAQFASNKLTDEEIRILTAKVMAGDERAKEQLIMENGRRAMHIAGAYIATGGDIEEMVSAAMVGLTKAVDRIREPSFTNYNPCGYIASFIHQHCYGQRLEDRTIATPRHAKQIHTCPLIDTSDGNDDFDIIEFYDLMEKIAESEFEKEVINLRAAGCTDDEIALKFDVSRSTVSRTRSLLYERFCSHVSS